MAKCNELSNLTEIRLRGRACGLHKQMLTEITKLKEEGCKVVVVTSNPKLFKGDNLDNFELFVP